MAPSAICDTIPYDGKIYGLVVRNAENVHIDKVVSYDKDGLCAEIFTD